MTRVLVALLFSIAAVAQKGTTAKHAMVVSARIEASQIGVAIIKKGGNAFDAMIATELALAVAYPYAGNISGGGFMVFRLADGKTGALDYREKAPLAASANMFLDDSGNVIPNRSDETAFAVGIPGTIAGIFAVHRKYGSLPIEQLFAPAIALAERGVVVTDKQQKQHQAHQKAIVRLNGSATLFAADSKKGDTLKYLAMAQTLRRIAKNGRKEFYKGKTASTLVKYIRQKGGIFTMKDMAGYKAKWRKPIEFKYKDLNVISMSPPSSGGICLAQIMKMAEQYAIGELGHNSAKYIQVLVEAERRSYADRNFYLGDPDFVDIPVNALLNAHYINSRMSTFRFDRASKSSDVAKGEIQFAESDETTHYSIVDSAGNAVSVTTTLNGAFGSKLFCDELGFFLNNQMDDFSSKPGVANAYGLIGAQANKIEPGKRMLSSMTPTIVERNGKLLIVLGSPGGSTIITSVLQTILNVYEFDMTMQQAVDAPRFHHQWLPDEISFEPGRFSDQTLQQLRDKGYSINEKSHPIIGKVDAILVSGNELEGGADTRGDDAAAGF